MTTYYFFHNLTGMTETETENETTYLFWMKLAETNRKNHNLESNARYYGR
ncbi:MAG: hypothetical protein SWO11_18885 [Thermodesulfobacteriota bacterium]|nr:hypothetical protein [Thermodesulfobacteriota bacterium]